MQSFEPGERVRRILGFGGVEVGYIRPFRPCNHDDGQAQCPRGMQFRFRGGAPRVFRDDHLDAVFGEQLLVVNLRERPARGDDFCTARQGFGRRGIDAADEVFVPRCGGEGGEVLAADGQQDTARGVAQSGGGLGHVSDLLPVVALLGLPGRAFDEQQRDLRGTPGGGGVGAHLHGEGVGGDDQRLDALLFDIADEARHPAETAAAPGDVWQARRGGNAGQREHRAETRISRKQPSQSGGFAGAAQDEDF